MGPLLHLDRRDVLQEKAQANGAGSQPVTEDPMPMTLVDMDSVNNVRIRLARTATELPSPATD